MCYHCTTMAPLNLHMQIFLYLISCTNWYRNIISRLVTACTWDDLFIYLGFYVAFNTVQVISRRVVGRAEETSTYSWSRFCTVNCRPMASNYQLFHLRSGREPNPGLRGGRRECYHSAKVAPCTWDETQVLCISKVSVTH